MRKVLLISTVIGCMLNTTIHAQQLNYMWSKSIGSTGQETINSIAPSLDNHLYEGGTFEGTVNFNPNGTAVTKTSLGLKNGFITKRQNDGSYVGSLFLLGLGTIQVNNLHVDAQVVFVDELCKGVEDWPDVRDILRPVDGGDGHEQARAELWRQGEFRLFQ